LKEKGSVVVPSPSVGWWARLYGSRRCGSRGIRDEVGRVKDRSLGYRWLRKVEFGGGNNYRFIFVVGDRV